MDIIIYIYSQYIITHLLTPTLPKAAWLLKVRCLTESVAVDEVELEEEGLAEILLDENATAKLPRAIFLHACLVLHVMVVFICRKIGFYTCIHHIAYSHPRAWHVLQAPSDKLRDHARCQVCFRATVVCCWVTAVMLWKCSIVKCRVVWVEIPIAHYIQWRRPLSKSGRPVSGFARPGTQVPTVIRHCDGVYLIVALTVAVLKSKFFCVIYLSKQGFVKCKTLNTAHA